MFIFLHVCNSFDRIVSSLIFIAVFNHFALPTSFKQNKKIKMATTNSCFVADYAILLYHLLLLITITYNLPATSFVKHFAIGLMVFFFLLFRISAWIQATFLCTWIIHLIPRPFTSLNNLNIVFCTPCESVTSTILT